MRKKKLFLILGIVALAILAGAVYMFVSNISSILGFIGKARLLTRVGISDYVTNLTKKDVATAEKYPIPDCTPVKVEEPDIIKLDSVDLGVNKLIEYKYYDVYGDTEKQVMDQMNRCGPRASINNSRDWAYTKTMTNFQYDYRKKNPCLTYGVKVGAHIVYYLPRWNSVKNPTAGLKEMWSKYIAIVREHEYHHGQIALDDADILLNFLNDPNLACELVTPAGEKIMANTQLKQDKFDKETDHGWVQLEKAGI